MNKKTEQISVWDRLIVTKNGKFLCEIDDLVVDTGKEWIAKRMKDDDVPASHIAVGTGTTVAVVADTALEIELTRVALTTAGGVQTAKTIAFHAEFPAGVGTGAITEIGLFNAATGGTMICRTTRSVINKEAGDSLGFTWTIEVQ